MNNISITPLPRPSADPRSAHAGDQDQFELPLPTRLLRIALRRRWVIVGALVACVMIGFIITMLTTPLYTATNQIEISREGNRVTEIQGVEREASVADLEFYQTQYGLLKSQSLAEQVTRNLRLADDPAFNAAFGIDTGAATPGNPNPRSSDARQARVRNTAGILRSIVTIEPVRGSRLVNISITTSDPALSAKIANAWADNFIQSNLARRYEATSYARKFLENRLEQLRQRLEESERQVVAYAAQQGLINLPGTVDRQTGVTVGERSLVADELTKLNEQLAIATGDRIQAQSQVERTQGGSNALALQNSAINSLRQRRAELVAERSRLLTQFTSDYPQARALASQIEALDRGIAAETGRVGTTIRNAYDSAQRREAALQARVDELKGGITDFRRRSIQYNIYQREADTNRQLYDGLLQRYKEIGIAGGVGTNNIAVVDQAKIPEAPSKPNLMVNLLLSIVAGLVIGAALAWLLEQIEEGVSDPVDVPRALNTPLLGTVPASVGTSPLAELENPRSSLVEAYLAIQTNLELSTSQGVPRSLSVTSTRPKEGKSTTSYALAHSLARARRRVVLIDGDMRSPMVHKEFGLSNEAGVSNFLAGNDDLSASLHASPQPNLSIMTAGPQPPNAADLLTGPRLRELIARLLETYDNVVVDSPPVMGLADAPLIASAVEGTIYAVEARVIRASMVRIALQRLRAANANLLGVVLTKFEAKHSNYGYGYDYGYGYGRGKAERA